MRNVSCSIPAFVDSQSKDCGSGLFIPIAFFCFPTIDHEVVKEIVMSAALPDLRVHDDGAVETCHFVSAGRTGFYDEFIMGHDPIVSTKRHCARRHEGESRVSERKALLMPNYRNPLILRHLMARDGKKWHIA